MRTINLTDLEIEAILTSVTLSDKHRKSLLNVQRKLREPKKRIAIASAKAKGRNLQNWAVEQIASLLNISLDKNKDMNDLRGREMGQSGTDVWIHRKLRPLFPFAVECKAQEQVSLVAFVKQAKENTEHDLPFFMLILKNKTFTNPLIVLEWEAIKWFYNNKEKGKNDTAN